MTAPQPDTKTLLMDVRMGFSESLTRQPWHVALDALAGRLAEAERGVEIQRERNDKLARRAQAAERRLAETEAQRDEALLVREGLISPVQKVIELQRRVATLEAALREIALGVRTKSALEIARAALDSLPPQPAQPDKKDARAEDYLRFVEAVPWQQIEDSLTAEDAAYVARRATWERK